MPFKLSFKDTPHSEAVQRECESLAETGKEIDLAGRAKHRDSAELAAREAFQRAHSQLRKHHDKQIFKHRRDGHEKS